MKWIERHAAELVFLFKPLAASTGFGKDPSIYPCSR